MTWVLVAACAMAIIPAGLRWLRIAQREHYIPPSVTRFAARWWTRGAVNVALLGAAVLGVVGSVFNVWLGFLAVLAQLGPVGLSLKGTSSPLAWTGRLERVAALTGGLAIVLLVLAGVLDMPVIAALVVLVLPVLVDAALWLLSPVEKSLGDKWVERAGSKLAAMDVEVVAITGSYGKTTTKSYLAHLLGGFRRTVASPASFNNRMGLAKAINEHLMPGTEVFIAEMGTYGPGEIAELCSWIPPKVSAMVAIGPVHLERFGSLEKIVESKSEILDEAEVGVISRDHPLLGDLAVQRAKSMRIVTTTGSEGRVMVEESDLGPAPSHVFASNLAVAAGIALALGAPRDHVISRFADLPVAEHRQSVSTSDRGFTIIDDTFNSNPAGARRALDLLASETTGAKALVTPGMVELGPVQASENREFAEVASAAVDHMLIVGHTNRTALLEGSANGDASVTVVNSREEAVAWVRDHLEPGDAVLYENDLPDHYP